MSTPTRRDFLKFSLQAGAACAGLGLLGRQRLNAIEPIGRAGSSRFKLSAVGYGFRSYFKAKKITLIDFIDFCADNGFAGAELTGYYFPEPVTDGELIAVKRHAYLRGVAVSGTSTHSDFARDPAKLDEQIAWAKIWIRNAAVLGAPYLRLFAGHGKEVGTKEGERICIRAFEELAEYAGTKGVFIGMENDGGVTPESTLNIVHGVNNPWFGLNLDLGNFHSDDVYADLVRCAPYAVNVHFKRTLQNAGKPSETADIGRMLKILSDANYQGYLALEYEENGDPYQVIPSWKKDVAAAIKAAKLG